MNTLCRPENGFGAMVKIFHFENMKYIINLLCHTIIVVLICYKSLFSSTVKKQMKKEL